MSLSSAYSKFLEKIKYWLSEKKIECTSFDNTECILGIVLLDQDCLDESALSSLQSCLKKNKHIIAIDGTKPFLPLFKAWELLKMGIDDILHLKYQEQLADLIWRRIVRWTIIENVLESDRVKNNLIGSCEKWKQKLRQIIEVACFSRAPILILGESGTGKELVARLIHDLDKRPEKEKLVLLDCSSVVPDLFGSEFFGHEKGSYTNAVSLREGAFALANRGTLFLDEIGELPLTLQAALLRVIQEGTYKRVGSNQWKKTQFRLISATNRDIKLLAENGQFRYDLFYRISTVIIHLPRLAERKEDISELATHFFQQALKTSKAPPFEKSLQNYLIARDYKGNLRELKQLITRITYKYTGEGSVTLGCLPESDRLSKSRQVQKWQGEGLKTAVRMALANGIGLKEIKRSVGDIAIELAVQEMEGQLPAAAQKLGVSERLVQGWWKENKGSN